VPCRSTKPTCATRGGRGGTRPPSSARAERGPVIACLARCSRLCAPRRPPITRRGNAGGGSSDERADAVE
jgi:hypothetical protein